MLSRIAVTALALLAASPVRAQSEGGAHAGPARTTTIAEARRAYLEADFRASAEQFDAVLRTPTVDRAAALEAHRHLAALRLLLGDESAARDHAEAAVALDPATTPPEGAPPALEPMLAAARERFAGRSAELVIEREPARGGAVVRARVDPSPRALGREIGLRCTRGLEAIEEVAEPPEVRLSIDDAPASLHCRAWLSGHGGAHLLETQRRFDVATDGSRDGSRDGDGGDSDGDEGGSAWPWIGVGAGVIAAGVIVGILLATSATDGANLGSPRADGW